MVQPVHRGHDEAGIEPAAQKRPDRHVRDQPASHRLEDARLATIQRFCGRHGRPRVGRRRRPISCDCKLSGGEVIPDRSARGQLVDVREQRVRRRDAPERQVRR